MQFYEMYLMKLINLLKNFQDFFKIKIDYICQMINYQSIYLEEDIER